MSEGKNRGDSSRAAAWIFIGLLAGGSVLRLASLENRPLHGDESVGALLSEQVKNTGSLVYEYSNRHGPFQYLLGGVSMAVGGTSAFWIRLPYALAGCLLPLCLLPLRRQIPDSSWILATGLLTFSPMFVYYSRYAIQEIEFAAGTAFLLACGASFAARGGGAALAGTFLAAAWLVTIKETFIIVGGCVALSLVLGALVGGGRFRAALWGGIRNATRRPLAAFLGALGGSLFIAAAYTDFFRDAAGLRRLARNLRQMVADGASSAGAAALHSHPASFYLSLLLRYEWLILALALVGAVCAFRSRRPLPLFLLSLSFLTGIVHLALPYKTPWLLLTPLLPLAILAGFGGGTLAESLAGTKPAHFPLVASLLVTLLPLPRTLLLNFVRPADPTAEPLVYHQAGEEQVRLATEIRRVLSELPRNPDPKAIVCLPYPWPLAWYLREEAGVRYERRPTPSESPESLAQIPLLVTLESADSTFLEVFTGSTTIPRFSLPGHVSRTYVLVPPAYLVARLWIRSDLAPPRSEE